MLVKGSLGSTQTIDQSPPGLPTDQYPVGSSTKPRLQYRATQGSSPTGGLPLLTHPPKPSENKTQTLLPTTQPQKHSTHRPKQLNQTPQNTDSQYIYGGEARHMVGFRSVEQVPQCGTKSRLIRYPLAYD